MERGSLVHLPPALLGRRAIPDARWVMGVDGGATADGGSGWGVTASAGGTGATATGASGTGAGEGGACGCRRRSSRASSSRLNRVRRLLSWSCSDATPLRALRARNKAMKPTRMTRNSMPTVPRLRASRALLVPWPDHGTARSAERKSGLLVSCTQLWPAHEGPSQQVNGAGPTVGTATAVALTITHAAMRRARLRAGAGLAVV